tara:strand:- start:308 stop:598 length:291 start_codon:yes stop_codon:yes gene_type:complete
MCIFRRAPRPQPLPTPPITLPRNPDLAKENELPQKKELVEEEEIPGVAYGSSAKEAGPAGGKRVGTKALRIPLNTGTPTGAATGGVNTGSGGGTTT